MYPERLLTATLPGVRSPVSTRQLERLQIERRGSRAVSALDIATELKRRLAVAPAVKTIFAAAPSHYGDPLDVKVVELDEICRQQQVDDECFAALDDLPRTAITFTIPRLLRAGKLYCVVPGLRKRAAVRGALHRPVHTDRPASILRTMDCTLYLDSETDPDAAAHQDH